MIFDYQLKAAFYVWIAIVLALIFFIARDKKITDLMKVFQIAMTIFLPVLGAVIVLLMRGANRPYIRK